MCERPSVKSSREGRALKVDGNACGVACSGVQAAVVSVVCGQSS